MSVLSGQLYVVDERVESMDLYGVLGQETGVHRMYRSSPPLVENLFVESGGEEVTETPINVFVEPQVVSVERGLERRRGTLIDRMVGSVVSSLVFRLSGLVVLDVRSRVDEFYDLYYVEVTVDSTAKRALRLWVKLIDGLKAIGYNFPVFVRWSRETDVEPEEFGYFVGVALAKMGIKLRSEKCIDGVELVRKIRGALI